MGLFDVLAGIGDLADTYTLAGSARDLVAGENPLDQLVDPFNKSKRVTGLEMLRKNPLTAPHISPEDTFGNSLGGMAAELLLDPTNLAGGVAALLKLRKLSQANKLRGLFGSLRPMQPTVISDVSDMGKHFLSQLTEKEMRDAVYGPRDLSAALLAYNRAMGGKGGRATGSLMDQLALGEMARRGALGKVFPKAGLPLSSDGNVFDFYSYPENLISGPLGWIDQARNDIAFIRNDFMKDLPHSAGTGAHEAAHLWQAQQPEMFQRFASILDQETMNSAGGRYYGSRGVWDSMRRKGDFYKMYGMNSAEMEALAQLTGDTATRGFLKYPTLESRLAAPSGDVNPLSAMMSGNLRRPEAVGKLREYLLSEYPDAARMTPEASKMRWAEGLDPGKYPYDWPRNYLTEYARFLQGELPKPEHFYNPAYAAPGRVAPIAQYAPASPYVAPRVDPRAFAPEMLAALGYNAAMSNLRPLEGDSESRVPPM